MAGVQSMVDIGIELMLLLRGVGVFGCRHLMRFMLNYPSLCIPILISACSCQERNYHFPRPWLQAFP